MAAIIQIKPLMAAIAEHVLFSTTPLKIMNKRLTIMYEMDGFVSF